MTSYKVVHKILDVRKVYYTLFSVETYQQLTPTLAVRKKSFATKSLLGSDDGAIDTSGIGCDAFVAVCVADTGCPLFKKFVRSTVKT